ncbi:IS30 family transposase [Streptomyces sp. DR7-3]|uniref:IS30 family transposase n=1 Tax=Streptomyces malaysiensis TaxID=92644 RepID=UPI002042FEA4|nr:IS30 family transposase [Streptomyces sp. DR7-3]MCM3812134.1 IS30 family transposase [Streptomyces sp. DR7-3]
MDFKIRQNRGPEGGGRLLREREVYLQLMQQGHSNREASRIVGINPRTGKRWRNGWHSPPRGKPKPPITVEAPAPQPSRYLRETDRIHIADRLREKASMRQIAAELGRSPSTISREIRRNGALRRGRDWTYRPHAAQRRAEERRPRPKPGKIGQNTELRDFIQHHLERRWSPEQICQALRTTFPDRPEMHVVHETIYQALYVQGRGELRRELTRALRIGRAMRRPHRQSRKRQPRAIRDMVLISERPAEAADRAVPGHWEGNLVIGKDGKSAIRHPRRTQHPLHAAGTAAKDHSAASTRNALIEAVTALPPHLKRSLAWDRGSEMASHKAFTIATGIPADHAKRLAGKPQPSVSLSF